MTTRTSWDGHYTLFGVAGQTTLTVIHDGYQSVARTIAIANHTHNYDIELARLRPRPDVSGIYTLTITASDECRVGLGEGHVPPEARVRIYSAEIRQSETRAEVTLSGARFATGGARFQGRIETAHGVFDLDGDWDPWGGELPDLVEEITTVGFLGISGQALGTISANAIAGTLAGGLSVFARGDAYTPPIASCYSSKHRFVLSR